MLTKDEYSYIGALGQKLLAGEVGAQNIGFAKSLIDYAAKNDKLSEKQFFWLKKLVDNPNVVKEVKTFYSPGITEPQAHAKPSKVSHVKVILCRPGELLSLHSVFDGAPKLQKPRFQLLVHKYPGVAPFSVSVRRREDHKFAVETAKGKGGYGRLDPDGTLKLWHESNLNAEERSNLIEAMSLLVQNPMKYIAESGKLMGICMFCGRPLNDPPSTFVGYGPICAKTWNLPWGATH